MIIVNVINDSAVLYLMAFFFQNKAPRYEITEEWKEQVLFEYNGIYRSRSRKEKEEGKTAWMNNNRTPVKGTFISVVFLLERC